MARSLGARFTRRSVGFALIATLTCALACDEGDRRPKSPEEWRARRSRLDASVWADEALAQQYERSLVALWDALLAADRRGEPAAKADVLAAVALEHITLGRPERIETLDHGIAHFSLAGSQRTLDAEQWAVWVRGLAQAGYQLVQSEWRHASFEPPRPNAPARSRVSASLHLVGPESGGAKQRRIAVAGELAVEWSAERGEDERFTPARVDATGLELFVRDEAAAFERIFSLQSPRRPAPYAGVHPLLLHDLDRDGLVDVLMVRSEQVLWNRGEGGFEVERLFEGVQLLTDAAVIADFDGDGRSDLLASRARGDLVLYRGNEQGRFTGEPQPIAFDEPLIAPSVLTAGDIDADGDLDVFVGQYEAAHVDGQMPTPFYDANDGHPCQLLLNDGDGSWTPATEAAGLGAKRFRRIRASSFVDLDADGDLDLLVVSDYAGVDLYHNDGSGRFSDANDTLRGDRHLFGMSSALADYDLDGRLDLFVAGVSSTAVRRLEGLGLIRPDRPDVSGMRMRMGFGNRLYVARDDGWHETDFGDPIARSGWTWGSTAFDFDNDGDPDLFTANGYRSGESTRDYDSTFWRHDLYDASSQPDPALASLFAAETKALRSGEESWGGHQQNRLLMNVRGERFVDVAFLMGVADSFDSRSALSADLDRDGRVDLLVTEDLGSEGEKLHVYRNRLDTGKAWIGVELREQEEGASPVGAAVTLRTQARTQIARVVTGETLLGQHATTLHFGLGDADRVEAIEVRWSNGAKRSLRDPAPGRYHRVRAPPGTGVPEILDSSLAVPTDVLRGRDLVESLLSELPEHADDAKPAAK